MFRQTICRSTFSFLRSSLLGCVIVVVGLSSGPALRAKAGEALKNHVCSAACAGGSCVFVHGEKGHVCTAACAKPAGDTTSKSAALTLKKHVCTSACSANAHMYAHGEKGHSCGAACKPKM